MCNAAWIKNMNDCMSKLGKVKLVLITFGFVAVLNLYVFVNSPPSNK